MKIIGWDKSCNIAFYKANRFPLTEFTAHISPIHKKEDPGVILKRPIITDND